MAAAVILPPDPAALAPLLGRVDDSKRLTPHQRERSSGRSCSLALAVGVGAVRPAEIDVVGIAPATRRAMTLALAALSISPDYVLLDFLTLPDLPCPQRGIPHGDALSLSIAAASIVAKVTRDRWMVEQDEVYPGYGFCRHKGYGTAEFHRDALATARTVRPARHELCTVGGARSGWWKMTTNGAATDHRKPLGRLGEDLAARHLEQAGWQIVARNWRTRRGEIDIVARDGEWLVFVEVRTRRAAPTRWGSIPGPTGGLGHSEEAAAIGAHG